MPLPYCKYGTKGFPVNSTIVSGWFACNMAGTSTGGCPKIGTSRGNKETLHLIAIYDGFVVEYGWFACNMAGTSTVAKGWAGKSGPPLQEFRLKLRPWTTAHVEVMVSRPRLHFQWSICTKPATELRFSAIQPAKLGWEAFKRKPCSHTSPGAMPSVLKERQAACPDRIKIKQKSS